MLKIPSFVMRRSCAVLLLRDEVILNHKHAVPTCCKDKSAYRFCHFIRKQLTHYAVLGIRRDASTEEIRAAYVTLSKKFHPDHNKSHDSAKRFIEINEAYSVLSKPLSRETYDASINVSSQPVYPRQNPYMYTKPKKEGVNSYYYYKTRKTDVKYSRLNFADRNPFLFIIVFLSIIGFYYPLWRFGVNTLTKPNTSENIQTIQSHIYFRQKASQEAADKRQNK